jgi:DNA-binding NtrC family response regulator
MSFVGLHIEKERSARRGSPLARALFLSVLSRMPKQLLLVEPDAARRGRLREVAGRHLLVDARGDFLSARVQLFAKPYDWLVTNLRLQAYNGLHLVHLAASTGLPTRILVYGEPHDVALAREAQRTGAFYESVECLDRAMAAYVNGALPIRDRREPTQRDRRRTFRGGRRSTDPAVPPPRG